MDQKIKAEFPLKDQLLHVMIDNEWSDLYITVGTYPGIKIHGELVSIDEDMEVLTGEDTLHFAQSLITEAQHETLLKHLNLDFAFSFSARRFRCNISFQMWQYMIVIRLLTSKIPNIDELGLPDVYKDITKIGQGLVLVTWPTWSWKSTTLSAMVDYINENYKKHIITIEDPIEYVHKHKKSIIEQKEVGRDIPDYNTALIWAMRQNPQVILFGEMRNREEIENALRLAETGHLVLSTLHTRSAYQTISRILDAFEPEQQAQLRVQLADSIVAVLSQRLLKISDGTWVKLVKEIMVKNSAISNLIRENDLPQLPSVMQMSSREWMQVLEKDIVDLIKFWIISEEEWLKYANNPKFIKEAVSGMI